MKLIATGWQYKVYDLENNRVRKITFSGFAQYKKILHALPRRLSSFVLAYKKQKEIRKIERSSNAYISSILPRFDVTLLGSPTFLNSADYEQDKVTTVQEYLKTVTVEEGKRIIDQYIHNIYLFWRYGFSDRAFKVGNNNGVNSSGKVVQIDFGELVTEKVKVEKLITNQSWLKEHIGKRLPEGGIRDYHNEALTENLTLKKLDELWGSQLKSL